MHHFIQQLFSGRKWQAVFLIGIFLGGCAYSSERIHPQCSAHRRSMDVMLVLQPEIRVFEQMPDGGQLYQESQSLAAQQIAQASIVSELENRAFTPRTMAAAPLSPIDVDEITKLFRSVNRSIQLHTFGPQFYPTKFDEFEYSLGPVNDLLEATGADGLIMAIGYQTGAEKSEKNWFSLAVIAPHGSIIWYNLTSMPDRYNLQDPEGVSAMVAETMYNFWEQGS